jgi:acetyl-CoA acetyltransferase
MTRNCAVVGVGESRVGRVAGATAEGLRLEAAVAAIRDFGGDKQQIDGVIIRQPRRHPQPNYSATMAERLGLEPAYINDIGLSGAGAAVMLMNAVAAVNSGLCNTVLCIGGDAGWSSRGRPSRGRLVEPGNQVPESYGAGAAPIMYALSARRHMYRYGTTSRQFGAVAVACRKHASLNSNAMMREPITIEEHQKSRWIVEPLRRLDCSQASDGAGAFIITGPDRARDFASPPVYVLGMGSECRFAEATFAADLDTSTGANAARRAFEMAGLTPADVDVAEIYDAFTFVVIVTLEDYGFCKKGEGGAYVENGRIELGGALPVNTHGGHLSQAAVGGMLHITEAVVQLRHQAGARQVRNAQVAVVSGECGETGIHATLLLGAEGR